MKKVLTLLITDVEGL